MLQQIIVIALLILAAVYLGFKFFSKKNRGKCSCGCEGCSSKNWNLTDQADSSALPCPGKKSGGNAF